MMRRLERIWYRSSHSGVSYLLLPLSKIYHFVIALRRFLYRVKIKKTIRLSVPVIVVGNITVGGTGKTPFVIWLAKFLRENNFKPGIISRGVGGKQQKLPRWVDVHSDPALCGDEAVLLAQRSQCPVVIGVDRVAAAKELLARTDCNMILSDDGLQHYRLGRDIEIALIDGDRGFGNRCLLPAGPLRESIKRLSEIDFVITQGRRSESQYCFQLDGSEIVSLKDKQKKVIFEHFKNSKIHAVAAIGNPERFFNSLRAQGLDIIEHVFPDHYLYQSADFNFNDKLPIIMTEKDAVKCQQFADERFWYLPVEAKVSKELVENLLSKIKHIFDAKFAFDKIINKST